MSEQKKTGYFGAPIRRDVDIDRETGTVKITFHCSHGVYETLMDYEDFLERNFRRQQITSSKGNRPYVKEIVPNGTKSGRGVRLHNLLMKPPKGMVVDHINNNGLDNRRCNLEVVTVGENTRRAFAMKRARANSSSGPSAEQRGPHRT